MKKVVIEITGLIELVEFDMYVRGNDYPSYGASDITLALKEAVSRFNIYPEIWPDSNLEELVIHDLEYYMTLQMSVQKQLRDSFTSNDHIVSVEHIEKDICCVSFITCVNHDQ